MIRSLSLFYSLSSLPQTPSKDDDKKKKDADKKEKEMRKKFKVHIDDNLILYQAVVHNFLWFDSPLLEILSTSGTLLSSEVYVGISFIVATAIGWLYVVNYQFTINKSCASDSRLRTPDLKRGLLYVYFACELRHSCVNLLYYLRRRDLTRLYD